MAAIDDITQAAQDVYFSINGTESPATGTSLTKLQNNYIRAFNLWLDEYENEAYWNKLREDDYALAVVANTTDYSFELPEEYRTPVFNQDKYLKVVTSDGTVIARFKMVDPNQRANDDPENVYYPDRATFVGRNVVLSRALKATEVGSTLKLDVVKYHPRLTTTDAEGLDLLPSKQLAVLGLSKNMTLSNVTKVSLSPSFAQKYKNELDKQIMANSYSNESYDAQFSSYGHINGIW